MKNALLLLFCLVLGQAVMAQIDPAEEKAARAMVMANIIDVGIPVGEESDFEVSSTYTRTESNIRMVYLIQTYKGIPVFNEMQVLAFRNGRLVSAAGSRVPQIDQKVNRRDATPTIVPEACIWTVLQAVKRQPTGPIALVSRNGRKLNFGTLGVSSVDIQAELVWLKIAAKEVRLTWQIEIAPLGTSDHQLFRVDAVTNVILDSNNYTVYEKHPEQLHHSDVQQVSHRTCTDVHPHKSNEEAKALNGPTVVNSATYRVIPFPAESPLHTGGTAALVTDPWSLAPGNATTLKWHYDGTTYHDSTRGNNVWAQEDRDNNNTTFGRGGVSSTSQPTLTIDYVPNYTVAPTTTTFQRFATTNLFYWNNLLHDISYLYGFDEVSGNFQNSNQGRGGLGSDYVIADAQDASGTNNANFSTPVDGSRPRMQMYLSTYNTPNRDGDLDNGVIAHEFGHGISNRLTGGPANSSCLGNAEQGGEGWSDYIALMTTTNWATATVSDGPIARPIGTYLFGQSPTGAGIRTYPYSTSLSVNPNTYATMATTTGAVHRIGEIWCTALWEMTWELIAIDGINPNIFNPAGTGGNSVAFKLVMEGMRLQPCSPGFIDARNAILRADTLLYNARYSCAIWKAFAKRGMGKFASQGSSNSTTDQTADFTVNGGVVLSLRQNLAQQLAGLNVTYTATIQAGNCSNLLNYILRDTLPSNVSYVNGGNYDPTNRVVSFPVNINAGDSQQYVFTVKINQNAYFPTVNLFEETVPTTTVSGLWTRSSNVTTNWTTSTAQSSSAPNALFCQNLTSASDIKLETTASISLPANPPRLSFMGYVNAEAGYDGGVVEITTNNGTTWTDLGSNMLSGGYNGTIAVDNVTLSGRSAFTGNNGGFNRTVINLNNYANQSIRFRFRFASDPGVGGTGWFVDDVLIKEVAQVNMRANLFSPSNTRVLFADTITGILPAADTCTDPVIAATPTSSAVCEGDNASFTVTASGSALTYQWETATTSAGPYAAVSGATGSIFILSNVNMSQTNRYVRCRIAANCSSDTAVIFTPPVILTVNARPAAPSASGASRCGSGSVLLQANGGVNTINWYSATTGGSLLQANSANWSTPVINQTTTYYAESVNNTSACASPRTPVTAVINQVSNTILQANTCGQYVFNGNLYTNSGIYADTLTNAAGCDSVVTLYLTIRATSSSTSVATACTSYTWNGTTYNNSGTYTYTTTNAAGCDSVATLLLIVGTSSQSTTNKAVCASQLPYTWNGQSYNQAGNYQVTYTNSTGCDSVLILNLTLVDSLQNVTVTGGGSYVAGGLGVTVGLNTSQPGVLYQLYRNGATVVGANVVGNGTSISFGNQRDSGTYTVIASTGNGCNEQMLGNVQVVIQNAPPQVFAVTGGGFYCSGTSGVSVGLSSSESGVLYQLFRSNGSIPVGSPISGTGLAIVFGNQLTVDVYTVQATRVSIAQTAWMAGNASVTVVSSSSSASMPGSISGPSNVCFNLGASNPANYSIRTTLNTTGYLWTMPAGATLISNGNDTSVWVRFDTSFVSGVISVRSLNSCNNSQSTARTISISRVLPVSPASISGPVNICPIIEMAGASAPVVYSVLPVANASQYNWIVPSGVNLIAGQGTTSITVTFLSSFTSGSISVRPANLCGSATTSRSLNVNKLTASTPGVIQKSFSPSIAAVTSICGVTQEVYRIRKVTNATSYLWTMNRGTHAIMTSIHGSGVNDTAVNIDFLSGITWDTISVRALTACSVSAPRTLALNTLATPPTVSTLTGNATPCIGEQHSYTAAAPLPTSSQSATAVFRWTRPSFTTVVSANADSSQVVIRYNAGFTGGTLRASAQSACGVLGTSFTLTLRYLTPTPTSITSSTGSYNACITNVITYTAVVPVPSSTQRTAAVYVWTRPANTTIVSATADSSSITVQFNAGYSGGTMTVRGKTACGVVGSPKSQTLTHTGCPTGTIAPAYTKGSQVPGNSVSGVIYPNPSASQFELQSEEVIQQVIIRDVTGKRLLQVKPAQNRIRFGDQLQPGVYMVEYKTNSGTFSTKIIKW
ncbi:MAG: M36 family metallopeptidase [Ferruginibacter sp.]